MNNQPRGKGFSFLSFFLGFLIGIIFLVGAVAGVAFYALNAKIDDVFGLVGVDNGKDENGDNKLINTDTENGGVETLLQLFTKVAALSGDTGNLSVGEVETLIPAVGRMVDGFHEKLNEFIQIDRTELVAVKFAEFGNYVSGKLLEIQPAALMENFGMGELMDNKILSLLFEGSEAKYVEVGAEKYPVYYDIYSLEDGNYKRKDGVVLSEKYLENAFDYKEAKRVNYYIIDETAYVTNKECTLVAPAARVALGEVYGAYTPEYATLSGNFYFKGEEKVLVTPVTLGTLSSGGLETLDDVYLTEFIGSEDELIGKIFGDVSVGDLMNGTADFGSMIDDVLLGDIIDAGDNKLLIKLSDKKISELSEAINDIVLGDVIEAGDNKLLNELSETKLSELSTAIDNLTLDKIMDISEDDKVLSLIKDATISTLPAKLNGIAVNEMFADDIYTPKDENGNTVTGNDGLPVKAVRGIAAEYNESYLYYSLTVTDDGKDVYELVKFENCELGKIPAGAFESNKYYTYGEAQGVWKILLYAENKETGVSTEKAYTINGMPNMITNVSYNMQHSTLQTLSDAGVLEFPEGSLDKTVGGKVLGKMTILQVINFVVSLPIS